MTHELKIHPSFFGEVISGKKNFEVRKNDRNFHVGDKLILKEYIHGEYTGEEIEREITYILDDENYCKEGYVILGIRPHGKWLEKDNPAFYNFDAFPDDIICPFCAKQFNKQDNCTELFKYCPNCGAKMDGERRTE